MLIKPNFEETPPYFVKYIQLVEEDNLLTALEKGLETIVTFYNSIAVDKEAFAYAEGKWNIKQVLQHCIDVERIFIYRAMRASRLDNTALPGFEENDYAHNDNSANLSLQQILEELKAVRQSNILFFKNADVLKIDFKISANKWETTALQLGWVVVGHFIHHKKVVRERYLA
jgi:uncharacterized damage-inducible protein DinB